MVGKRKVNRKRSQGFPFPAPLAAVLVMAAVVALGYLWLCGRCEALALDIKAIENRKTELRRAVLNEEFKWSNLRSMNNVRAALKRFNLEMDLPGQQAVVYLTRELDPDRLTPAETRTVLRLASTRPRERHD